MMIRITNRTPTSGQAVHSEPSKYCSVSVHPAQRGPSCPSAQ